jgi:hypothetical protein
MTGTYGLSDVAKDRAQFRLHGGYDKLLSHVKMLLENLLTAVDCLFLLVWCLLFVCCAREAQAVH